MISFLPPLTVALSLFIATVPITPQPKSPKPPLELSSRIISRKYCAENSDSTSLELTLRLRYVNTGTQKIILYKGHDLFYQTRIRSTPTNGPAYEVFFLNSRYFDEELEAIDQPAPGKVFVTIAPGAAYERDLAIGITLVSDGVERGSSAIKAGDHTLQVIVSTWYRTRPLAQKLRQQWQGHGLLWVDPLVSAPTSFAAQRPERLEPCR